MTEFSSKRFDEIAGKYATSEVHSSSPTLDRLHEILPRVDSICDIKTRAATMPKAKQNDRQLE